MATRLKFGIDQFIVHLDFEPAPIRREEGQGFYFRFELLQQIIRQADSPASVMSDRAVSNNDL
jgi:hypothetical protein